MPRLEDLSDTCALDVADRGGSTLEEVGSMLNLTRERVRQIERSTMEKLAGLPRIQELGGLADLVRAMRPNGGHP
jgi:hypothetical protein